MPGCDCPPYNCADQRLRSLNNDQAASTELVRKFTGLVRAIVQRELGQGFKSEWEEAQQIAFIRIFKGLSQWKGRAPFCKWLAIVAANAAKDLKISARRDRARRSALNPSEFADPQNYIFEIETRESMQRVMDGLPEEWRKAFELASQDVDRKEIAARLGMSLRTVQYWIAATLERLRLCRER